MTMGLFGSLFGSKSKTKNQVDPWDEALPYITGNDEKGIPGFMPDAANLYKQGIGAIDNAQGGIDAYSQQMLNRFNTPDFNMVTAPGGNAMAGAYDAQFNRVANTKAPQVNMNNIDRMGMTQARAGQGALDPTTAMQKMLSGQPDNPYLQQQIDAMSQNMARNVNENVMPGLRSEALASGQYGGSRQGIAEGLAMSRMNQDLAPAITNLLGGSYENAQNRMFGTASQLNDQAFQNANQFNNQSFQNANLNADRNMNTQQFNANLGLSNNAQEMEKQNQRLGARQSGLDMLNQGMGMQDTQFQNYIQNQLLPNQLSWNNLNQYGNVAVTGAGLGNQSSGKQTSTPGIVPAILGTAAGIGGIASGMGGMGGIKGMFGR